MGAENSTLGDCEWGPPLDCPPKFPFEMYPVTKPDGNAVTVFEPKNADSKDSVLLQKCTSSLRGLRHPNIVRYIDCGESSEGFWLATESVTPLSGLVADMSSEELSTGLYDLLQALDFLHSKLGICHNNLCLSSVFVSSDGSWKLGGLEHACKFTEATQQFLEKCRAFRHEDCLSPEEKTNKVKIDGSIGHVRDIFAFGVLVESILDMVTEKDDRLKTLEREASVCVNVDPAARPAAATILNLSAFRCDLRDLVNFLHNIAVKSEPEKKEFFSTLMPRLRKLPESALARRLVVPLLARFVLLNEWANKMVIPYLLMPKGGISSKKSSVEGLLSEPLFRQCIVNTLYNIFHVHDSHIRLILLEHFSNYAHLFTRQQLEDDIFLQILLGVRDSDDKIVAASLRALADLVPLLGGDIVIGGNRKAYFFHGMPKQVSPQDLQKMESPNNVDKVLSPHKPLLKTLAAASASNKAAKEKSSEERERKAREREQRREEARLKREERKKRLKEQQMKEKQEVQSQNADDLKTSKLIEEVGDQDGEELALKSKLEKDEDNESHDSGMEKASNNVDIDSEKEGPDWSDWEDADQKISEEIEAELQNMPDSDHIESKVQTSPSPYRNQPAPSPPPVKVDWTDIPAVDANSPESSGGRLGNSGSSGHGSRGPLNLGVKSKDKNALSQDTEAVDDNDTSFSEDWGNDNWNSSSNSFDQKENTNETVTSSSSLPAGPKSLKLKKSSEVKSHVKRSPRKNSLEDLGVGLDIKSIEIEVKSAPELDFFADMAPSIPQTKSKDVLSAMSSTNSKEFENSDLMATVTETETPKTNGKLFAVAAASEEDAKGWGGEDDDLDWGNEDF